MKLYAFCTKMSVFLLLFLIPLSAEEAALSLEDCIRLAEQGNTGMQLGRFSVESSGIDLRDARGSLYPTAGLEMNAGNSDSDMLPGGNGSNSVSMSLSQVIYSPGMLPALKMAALGEESARQALRTASAVTANQVASLYFGILSSRELIRVYRENIQVAAENIRRIRVMYELGTRKESDVLKAEVQKGNFESQLLTEEQNLRTLIRSLNTYMGREPEADLKLADVVEAGETLPLLEEARVMMLQNNSELQSAELNRRISELQLKTAKEGYFPTLGATYSYGRSSNSLGSSRGSSVSLGLSLPLFKGFRTRNAVQRQSIQVRRSEVNIDETRRALEKQLADHYSQYDMYQQLERINETSLESSRRDLEIVTQQYEMGSSTILDQMNAQLSVLNAQSNLVKLRHSSRILESKILELIGQ